MGLFNLLRKEVIHRQLPLPMPCYDFTPVTGLTLTPHFVLYKHFALILVFYYG